jgi:hypothetical protein
MMNEVASLVAARKSSPNAAALVNVRMNERVVRYTGLVKFQPYGHAHITVSRVLKRPLVNPWQKSWTYLSRNGLGMPGRIKTP